MANELQAKITADISDLEKKLGKAESLQESYAKSIAKTQKDISENIAISRQYEKAIEQLNKELADGTISQKDYSKQLQRIKRDEKETQIETANLRKELVRLKKDQKDLASTSATAGKGMSTLDKQTANATPTLIEFSRVIQDAPYGMQGVANNIQQLTTNFGYLQKQAGGTVPALKAFAGSFLGPAGIVFAVSTITSLLVTYGDELLASVRSTDALADATREYLGEATAEVSQLQTLVRIASDESNSREVREQALKKLKAEYPEYLGFLDLETINSKEAKTAVDELSKSLVRQAQIRGLNKLIEEKSLELTEKEIEANKKGVKEANKQIQVGKNRAKSYEEQREAFATFGKDYAKIQDSIAKKAGERVLSGTVERETEEIRSEVNELIAFLETKLVEQFEFDSLFRTDPKEAKKAADEADKLAKKLEQDRLKLIEIDNYVNDEIFRNAEQSTKDVAALYATMADDIERRADNTDIINSEKAFKNIQDIAKKIQEIQKKFPELKLAEIDFAGMDTTQLDAFSEKLETIKNQTQVFSNVAGAALGGFSTKLADVFKTGNDILDASVAALIKSGEQLLQELIKQSIQASAIKKSTAVEDIATNQAVATSNAIVAGSSTAASSGPAAAFVLPALIGAAIGFIAASFAGLKFAHGGIVPGLGNRDTVPAMLTPGEIVMNGRHQANTLMAIAEGNVNHGKSTSKNDDITINAVLRGQNQIVQFNRASKFNKRFNG